MLSFPHERLSVLTVLVAKFTAKSLFNNSGLTPYCIEVGAIIGNHSLIGFIPSLNAIIGMIKELLLPVVPIISFILLKATVPHTADPITKIILSSSHKTYHTLLPVLLVVSL